MGNTEVVSLLLWNPVRLLLAALVNTLFKIFLLHFFMRGKTCAYVVMSFNEKY